MIAKVVRLASLRKTRGPTGLKEKGSAAKKRSAKWQYQLFSAPASTPLVKIHDDLNRAGLECWELVSVFVLAESNIFVFKKRRD
jgi:hypothetical protein